ncbi:MAG TPA: hypothetical protein VHW93_09670 [Acidimicrobiales bacterium]|nr:hypothetical protein [Acidimicrobiales bacterium]
MPAAAATRGATTPMEDPTFVAGLRSIPSGPVSPSERRPASDLVGFTPAGDRVELPLRGLHRPLLLCFLHIRCEGCDQFWQGLADGALSGPAELPDTVSAVVVTKGPDSVESAAVARAAAGVTRVPVVMSDKAWADYRVSAYPFFVLVDPDTVSVVGETVGFGWSDVRSMIGSTDG